jgi:hypothetical protein
MGGSIAAPPVRDLSSWLPLSDGEHWYVVRTLAQRECHAAQQLANQDYCAFLPLHLKNRRHARRVETISAPLFPRSYSSSLIELVTAGAAAMGPWASSAYWCAAESLRLCPAAWSKT